MQWKRSACESIWHFGLPFRFFWLQSIAFSPPVQSSPALAKTARAFLLARVVAISLIAYLVHDSTGSLVLIVHPFGNVLGNSVVEGSGFLVVSYGLRVSGPGFSVVFQ